jgi:hypothetical protein
MTNSLEALASSEFIWGIGLGVGLTWLLFYFQKRESLRDKEHVVAAFCSDLIRNINLIIGDMDANLESSGTIYKDFLVLLDVELSVFSRSHEQLVRLPEKLRQRVRVFITEVALTRVSVLIALSEHGRVQALAESLQAGGDSPGAQRQLVEAATQMQSAKERAKKLKFLATDGDTLLADLDKFDPR